MTPVFCTVRHDPPETYGNCLAAALASILDMDVEDVPNFAENGNDLEAALKDMRDWLGMDGLSVWLTQYDARVSLSDLMSMQALNNPDCHYMLLTADHAVVCCNDKIVHDPAWVPMTPKIPEAVWTVLVVVKR